MSAKPDPREFTADFAATHRENGKPRTGNVGRPKKLNAERAFAIYLAQVQIQEARKLIDKTLDEAGFSVSVNARGNALRMVWKTRGRVDVLYKTLETQPIQRQARVGDSGGQG